eukprot:g1836.t1
MADGGHIGPAEHGVLLTEAKRDDANPVHGPSQIQIKRYNRNSWSAGESSKKTKNLMSSNPLSKHDKSGRRLSRWFVTNQKVEAWDEKALNTLHVCILVSLVVAYACHALDRQFAEDKSKLEIEYGIANIDPNVEDRASRKGTKLAFNEEVDRIQRDTQLMKIISKCIPSGLKKILNNTKGYGHTLTCSGIACGLILVLLLLITVIIFSSFSDEVASQVDQIQNELSSLTQNQNLLRESQNNLRNTSLDMQHDIKVIEDSETSKRSLSSVNAESFLSGYTVKSFSAEAQASFVASLAKTLGVLATNDIEITNVSNFANSDRRMLSENQYNGIYVTCSEQRRCLCKIHFLYNFFKTKNIFRVKV